MIDLGLEKEEDLVRDLLTKLIRFKGNKNEIIRSITHIATTVKAEKLDRKNKLISAFKNEFLLVKILGTNIIKNCAIKQLMKNQND